MTSGREDVSASTVSMGKELRWELGAIAGDYLGDVLDASVWSSEQCGRLGRYLRSEMAAYGLLSVEHARESGVSLGMVRRQARALLARIERAS
jgi:hypothetical protein